MVKSSYIAVLTAISALCGHAQANNGTQSFNFNGTKSVIAFGDSYTFIQGTAGNPNHTFIGDYKNFKYTASQLLSTKIVQNFTSTAEGGPNWIERLTGCATTSGYYSPTACRIQLWDFAFAGASVSREFLPPHSKTTVPLVNQTQQFLTYGEPALRNSGNLDKSKALVALWIGVNDVFDSKTYKPAEVSYQDFWTAEIRGVFEQSVTPLYESGFKNFLFMNLPPLDRTAANQKTAYYKTGEVYPSKTQVDLWGSILSNQTQAFGAAYPDAKAMLYDANKFLNGVMDNPKKYGISHTATYCAAWNQIGVLTNATAYGCDKLQTYFWYNALHL
ncbi:hypothetical protein TruAng_006073 [Truncatella angustata]|nr:hypothetical protein TruAng_006073 [Truncatella angustata]